MKGKFSIFDGNEFCFSSVSLGAYGSFHPHHHSPLQLSQNDKNIFLEQPPIKTNQRGDYSKEEVETVFGIGIQIVVPILSGNGIRSALFTGQGASLGSAQYYFVPRQFF
ncbi:MAG TPA: hypothetical protein P5280_10680 [Cyclobacteriaceae bacterium]|nr:hypothetical protein [Cyclobacteriaceae bacterium]